MQLCSFGAFCAIKDDGSAVVWGAAHYGGDASAVTDRLRSGVVSVHGNVGAGLTEDEVAAIRSRQEEREDTPLSSYSEEPGAGAEQRFPPPRHARREAEAASSLASSS